jgi:folate-binding protein YgfZ
VSDILELAMTGAVLVPRYERETLVVTGAERERWLNGMLTCDVSRVAPGRGAHGLALSKVGKIQTDVDVVATPQALLLGVAAGTGRSLRDALDRMLVMEDAELVDGSAQWAWTAIHGVRAAELGAWFGRAVTGAVVAEIDWTSLGGAALVMPRSEVGRGPRLEHAWAKVATPEEWEVLRLECGWAEFGVDYGPSETPHDASLERRAVAWNKGCYLGQEVVCKQESLGKPRRRLVSLSIEGQVPPPRGSLVQSPGSDGPAGEITSSAPSREGDRAVAMARLKTTFATEGRELEVLGFPARVRSKTPRPGGSC